MMKPFEDEVNEKFSNYAHNLLDLANTATPANSILRKIQFVKDCTVNLFLVILLNIYEDLSTIVRKYNIWK